MAETTQFGGIGRARQTWMGLSLAHQFLLASAVVLIAGMLVIGFWVTRQIEENVTRNAAATTALYVDSVIAPILSDIKDAETLSPGRRRALDEVLSRGALGSRLDSFKIWKAGGLIAYSNRAELIGKRFDPSESLRTAWDGQVVAEFDKLAGEESERERADGLPLLEIYSPIREPWSGEVVAVAEFYEVATDLKANLTRVRLRTWLVVALVTLAMIGLLFGIVRRGSTLITAQRGTLEARVTQLSRLLRENEQLHLRARRASNRATELNERYLRKVSADLHDGPAQLLALASLRIGSSRMSHGDATLDEGELSAIQLSLDEAMRDIRDICRGLALPQLEPMSLAELLEAVVSAHRRRTGTDVALRFENGSPALTQPQKICIYRFVQEALNNGYRHAGGVGQAVAATVSENTLSVVVEDSGQGFAEAAGEGLGIAGLRERVESLGGDFRIASSHAGTRVAMTLQISAGESA